MKPTCKLEILRLALMKGSIGSPSPLHANWCSVAWTLAICLKTSELTSSFPRKYDSNFSEHVSWRSEGPSLFQNMAPNGSTPFTAPFSGLLENFQWKAPTSLIMPERCLSSQCHSFKCADLAWPRGDGDLMSPRPKVLRELSAGFAHKQALWFFVRTCFKFITSINKCMARSNRAFTMV